MRFLIVNTSDTAAAMADWFTQAGWAAPAVFANSDEALAWATQQGGCDVLVAELDAQPTDGPALRDALTALNPQLKTVFLGDRAAYADRLGSSPALPKAIAPQSIDFALRKLFEQPAAAQPVAAKPTATTTKPVAKPVVAAATETPTPSPSPKKAAARPSPKSAPQKTATKIALDAPAPVHLDPVETTYPADALVGKTLGEYQIDAKIGETADTAIYRATQTSMARTVCLYALHSHLASDPAKVAEFTANASAKANVRNADVLAIYEAGQSQGTYYYTAEYVPCVSAAQLARDGKKLDELTALKAFDTLVNICISFAADQTAHTPLTADTIFFETNGRARTANVALSAASGALAQSNEETAAIAESIRAITGESTLGLDGLLAKASSGTMTLPELQSSIAALMPKSRPKDSFQIESRDRAKAKAMADMRKRQNKSMLINIAVAGILIMVLLIVLYQRAFGTAGGSATDFNKMILIPAGEFMFQDKKMELPEFWIGEYQVTIGQYAKFLKHLEEHPEDAAKFAHPKQPKGKSHVPLEWADMNELNPPMLGYYARVLGWGKYQGQPLSLNSPVFSVDWYDAWAYAKWKGARLPTEEEWEKAARGPKGNRFPWGDQEKHAWVNSGQDLDPNPNKGGHIDGWRRWNPVDAMKKDQSFYGVGGMAGNVSEWTASFEKDPQGFDFQIPVIRGGNWRHPDYQLTRRVVLLTEHQQDNALGFRIASDVPLPVEKKSILDNIKSLFSKKEE